MLLDMSDYFFDGVLHWHKICTALLKLKGFPQNLILCLFPECTNPDQSYCDHVNIPNAIIPNYIAWIIPSPLGPGPGIHPSGVGIHCRDWGIREIDVVGVVSFGISVFEIKTWSLMCVEYIWLQNSQRGPINSGYWGTLSIRGKEMSALLSSSRWCLRYFKQNANY